MADRRTLMRVRDVFAMREHLGWAHYVASQVARRAPASQRIVEAFHARLSAHTDARSIAFDDAHGTETFARVFVPVQAGVPAEKESWGYGPVNQDFFREMLDAVQVPYRDFAFVDIGAGKGAAVLLASEYGFRRYLGIELSGELLDVARRNAAAYRSRTGRSFEPEWIQHDFFRWGIPQEQALFFLNNPFPEDLSLRAMQHIEASLVERPREAVLVYRKVPRNVSEHLHASPLWEPLRLAPYWRIYAASVPALKEVRRSSRPPAGRAPRQVRLGDAIASE